MALSMRTGVQVLADTSVSELLEQWIGEQLGRLDAARGPRPRIGVLAVGGTLRDGRWPVYGSDAPTAHAILEAGGLPCLIPVLPLLEGYDPLQILSDEHTFALLFDVFWPVVRTLDGLILSGGGMSLPACMESLSIHRRRPLISGAMCGSATWRFCPGCSACRPWGFAGACSS